MNEVISVLNSAILLQHPQLQQTSVLRASGICWVIIPSYLVSSKQWARHFYIHILAICRSLHGNDVSFLPETAFKDMKVMTHM